MDTKTVELEQGLYKDSVSFDEVRGALEIKEIVNAARRLKTEWRDDRVMPMSSIRLDGCLRIVDG